MWKFRLTNPRGEWVIGACLPILLLRYNWTFQEYVTHLLHVPDGDAPGGDAPFYFLRVQFVDGICAGVGMLLTLILVALTWKPYQKQSSMALFMGWIWCMPSVVTALMIYCRTSRLMDAQQAVSGWKTYDEWSHDRWAPFWATLLTGLALHLYLRWRFGWAEWTAKHLFSRG
jgi:hypothetical protein